MTDIDLLFKVVSKEAYAYDFLESGAILLRNLPWFRYVEATTSNSSLIKQLQQGGGSPYDYYSDSGPIGIDGIPFQSFGPIKFSVPQEDNKYLFCLSRFKPLENDQLHIHEKFLGFGDYAIVILDSDEFIRRFEEAVSQISETRSYMGHNVEYFDPTALEGRRDLWCKESQFKWQNEYRFMWETLHIQEEVIMLHLGNLSDIARIYPTRELVIWGN